jgi:hypothetical protein
MDEVIEFLERYAKAENQAYAASLLEADRARFDAKVERAQAFYWNDPDATLLLSLAQVSDAGDEDAYPDEKKEKGRRIFLVRRYEHPKLGDLYAAWTSPPRPGDTVTYGEILYVARKEGDLKIVSVYQKGMPGPDRAWEYRGGEEIKKPGKAVEVRKLLPPEMPDDRADYDAA